MPFQMGRPDLDAHQLRHPGPSWKFVTLTNGKNSGPFPEPTAFGFDRLHFQDFDLLDHWTGTLRMIY